MNQASSSEELLQQARDTMTEWRDGRAGSAQSTPDEALLELDAMIETLEGVVERWHSLQAEDGELDRGATESLDQALARARELSNALAERDTERTRVLAQAVDLAIEKLTSG